MSPFLLIMDFTVHVETLKFERQYFIFSKFKYLFLRKMKNFKKNFKEIQIKVFYF